LEFISRDGLSKLTVKFRQPAQLAACQRTTKGQGRYCNVRTLFQSQVHGGLYAYRLGSAVAK